LEYVLEPLRQALQRLHALTRFCVEAASCVLTVGFFLQFAAAKGDDGADLLDKSQSWWSITVTPRKR
jgi:hypothetical protein